MSQEKEIERVCLSRSHKRLLLFLTRSCIPEETVALLFGKQFSGKMVVEEMLPVRNLAISSRGFAISQKDILAAENSAESPLLGVYHSHALSSELSVRDRRQMRPSMLWIVGVLLHQGVGQISGIELRAYIRTGERIVQLSLEELA